MILYTGGTFDLLHPGHVELLSWLKYQIPGVNSVVVGLNTDDFVESFKGSPPVMSYYDRRTMLLSLKTVDMVVENTGGADSREAILEVMPQFVAIGSDWAHPKDYLTQLGVDWEWLHTHKIGLMFIPRLTTTISTTEIKGRVGGVPEAVEPCCGICAEEGWSCDCEEEGCFG